MSATSVILVLNAGSSSLKFAVFEANATLDVLARGRVTGISSQPVFRIDGGIGKYLDPKASLLDATREVMSWFETLRHDCHLVAIGHRLAHGGGTYTEPVVLTSEVRHDLCQLTPLAPLYQPYSLSAITLIAQEYPDMVQIGCFDTSFHRTIPPHAARFAIPAQIERLGVRRYGFHGLSYEWIARRLAEDHPRLHAGRVVVAHLGNGASLCALQGGQSVATTMGMTPLDGVPMGTRSGAIDPGVILFLLQEAGLTPSQVEDILYRQSGLKALSGISNAVGAIRDAGGSDALFSLSYFAFHVARSAASLSVDLGGIDALVFSGGIGENDAAIREEIIGHLRHLAPFEALVVPTNEERVIADLVWTQFLAHG